MRILVRSVRELLGGPAAFDYSAHCNYPAVTHIVTASAAGGGTGSEGSPLTIAEAMALSTVTTDVHIEARPGVYPLTLDTNGGGKLVPTNAAHATNRWICRTTNPSTTAPPSARSRLTVGTAASFRNAGFFGFGNRNNAALTTRNAIWDGWECLEYTDWPLGAEDDEVFGAHLWRSTDCVIRRARMGMENQGVGHGYNFGNLFCESNTRLIIEDSYLGEIGAGGENGAAVLFYGADTCEVRYSRFTSIRGTGVFLKGEPTQNGNRANRIHHNFFDTLGEDDGMAVTVGDAEPVDPTDAANGNWVYCNIAKGCNMGFGTQTYAVTTPRGLWIVNNLAYACTRAGIALKRFQDGQANYAATCALQNNIVAACLAGIELIDAGWTPVYDNWAPVNYNRWYDNTRQHSPGGGTGTFATWQGYGEDLQGSVDDPLFQHETAGDFRLKQNSPARNAGQDILRLLGGSASAAINQGPFISADMSDRFGPRG